MDYCSKCGKKLFEGKNFCQGCGAKIQEDLKTDNANRTIMEIRGGSGEFRRYIAYLKKDGIVIGKGGIFNSQFSFTEIDYDEVEDIQVKKIGLGKETDNDKANITFKTKNGHEIKIKGFRIRSAIVFAEALKRILAGDKEIFNYQRNEIETDNIPIFPGDTNKNYINLGKVFARADSSLFSKTTTMDDVNARLREEAVKIGANTIINANYERSISHSWRGMKAEGTAVLIESDEKKCPFCAELIKKEAIKCKHCQSDLIEQ